MGADTLIGETAGRFATYALILVGMGLIIWFADDNDRGKWR